MYLRLKEKTGFFVVVVFVNLNSDITFKILSQTSNMYLSN